MVLPDVHLIYRSRWLIRPLIQDQSACRIEVFCGSSWDESEVEQMAIEAQKEEYYLRWETLPLTSGQPLENRPETIYVFFEGGYSQDDPLALELSNPVGRLAVSSYSDVVNIVSGSSEWEWEDCWEVPIPWLSPFALSPFPQKSYSDSLGSTARPEDQGFFTT